MASVVSAVDEAGNAEAVRATVAELAKPHSAATRVPYRTRKEHSVETIICGVDRSVGAREALRIAVDLRDRFGYRVVAVHVVHREEADGERDIDATTLRARGRAERVLAEVLDDEGLVGTIEWRAEVGETAEQLAAVAEEERAALIVLGSQTATARAGLRGWLANELARRTAVPVAVPAERRIVAGGRDVGRGEATGKAA